MTDPFRFDDRLALVTGGSRGIGAAVVAALAARGARVLAVARASDALDAVCAATGAVPVVADVATEAGRDVVVAAVAAASPGAEPRLDVLVNNVGTNRRKPTVAYTADDWEHLVETNQRPAFELCRRLQPALAATAGAIVNVSSVSATQVVRPSSAAYAMSKGAIDSLTRFLACEWAPAGIRVNAVAPWYVATPLTAAMLGDPARKEAILDRTPLRRVGTPEDVANAVVYLASPAASWVTGQILTLDGGFSVLGW